MKAAAGQTFDSRWLQHRLAELVTPGTGPPRYCVAWSGGLDSTALLAALVELRDAGVQRRPPPFGLRALHVDHHLQAASRLFSGHCRKLARNLRVPLQIKDAWLQPRRGESVEQIARNARYALLAAALRPGEWLLTAQHAEDQLETVLLQLLRGAGTAGLAAMADSRSLGSGTLLRPLLPVSREALRAYLTRRRIGWVEDPSNLDPRFDRNYLRAQVLPALRARWPAAARTVSRSARLAAEASELLRQQARRDSGAAADGYELDLAVLRRLSPPRLRGALRHWIVARDMPLPDERRLTEVQQMIRLRADARPRVDWPGASVRRHQERLHAVPVGTVLEPARAAERSAPLAWRWAGTPRLALPDDGGSLSLQADRHGDVDLARMPAQLVVCERAGGERLQRQRGHRDLKDLLREAGLPSWERDRVPLVFAAGTPSTQSRQTLLAVGDLWIAESLRCGPGSRRRGRFVWQRD